MALSLSKAITCLVLGCLAYQVTRLFYNIFLHPLKKYPGPIGAQATDWYKTYIELFQQKNWTDQLFELHKQYGKCYLDQFSVVDRTTTAEHSQER